MRSVGSLIGLALAACGGGSLPTEPGPGEFLPLASVSAGSLHSCGLTSAGAAYCWGSGAFNQLGDSTQRDTATPVAVHGGLTFTHLSAGRFHTCAVTPGGAAYCWGESFSDVPVPAAVGLVFATITTGGTASEQGSHTCGLTPAGEAYCWGSNYDGQLGSGDLNGPQSCGGIACSPTPVPVSGGLTFAVLSAGESYTCGVTRANVAYCWGSNGSGELGVGTTTGPQICGSGHPCSATPVAVSGSLTIATINATSHTCAVTTSGKAYCWGNNHEGELGNGTLNASMTPVAVSGGLTFSAVSGGFAHTCGLTRAGKAYCWGSNNSGRLGNGRTTNSRTPVLVSGGHTFATVSAVAAHTCAVTVANVAYCWGSSSYGQLGNGSTLDSSVPVVVRP